LLTTTSDLTAADAARRYALTGVPILAALRAAGQPVTPTAIRPLPPSTAGTSSLTEMAPNRRHETRHDGGPLSSASGSRAAETLAVRYGQEACVTAEHHASSVSALVDSVSLSYGPPRPSGLVPARLTVMAPAPAVVTWSRVRRRRGHPASFAHLWWCA
jgi:hypothetical protein